MTAAPKSSWADNPPAQRPRGPRGAAALAAAPQTARTCWNSPGVTATILATTPETPKPLSPEAPHEPPISQSPRAPLSPAAGAGAGARPRCRSCPRRAGPDSPGFRRRLDERRGRVPRRLGVGARPPAAARGAGARFLPAAGGTGRWRRGPAAARRGNGSSGGSCRRKGPAPRLSRDLSCCRIWHGLSGQWDGDLIRGAPWELPCPVFCPHSPQGVLLCWWPYPQSSQNTSGGENNNGRG